MLSARALMTARLNIELSRMARKISLSALLAHVRVAALADTWAHRSEDLPALETAHRLRHPSGRLLRTWRVTGGS